MIKQFGNTFPCCVVYLEIDLLAEKMTLRALDKINFSGG